MVKWVGAPDKTDDLSDKQGSWGRDVCGGDAPAMGMVMPFIWYFVFYLGLLSYLIFNIWSLKEELAGAPAADTEMGKKPAVAVAPAAAARALTFGDGSGQHFRGRQRMHRKKKQGAYGVCPRVCLWGPGSPGPRDTALNWVGAR